MGIRAAEAVMTRACCAFAGSGRGFFCCCPSISRGGAGSHLGRLLAFRRGDNLIAVVPRFTMTLSGEWR